MEDERALLVGDILTTGYYSAAIAGIADGDTVAVIGAGPVGVLRGAGPQDVVRSGGTIAVVGMYVSETTELQRGVAWTRMLRYVFAGIAPIHAWWDEAMRAVADGRIDPLPIISHTLPLEESPKGYDLFDRREATKVILKP